jgi:ATP-dependent RNA helicase MSS116
LAYASQDEPQQSTPNPFTKFADLQDRVHPNLLAALTQDMGLETMTEVQQRTLAEGLTGQDVYVCFVILFGKQY